MSVLKKFGLSVLFVLLMYMGGLGTQSDNTAYQGMGAVAVMIAFVLLFILFKVNRLNLSAFPAFIVFGSITLFILYSLGLLQGGKNNIISNNVSSDTLVSEGSSQAAAENVAPENKKEEGGGFWSRLFSSKEENEMGFNPEDYPFVEGYAEAISGSMLSVNGLHIKLLGVEAPYMQQTCANKFGQAYNCGQVSRNWLQDWLQNKTVKCHIISPEKNGRATGVCFSQGYDVGAVVVNAGWAVAYTKNTDIYVPYEQQAGTKKRGLWAGTFYKPWDWKKLQNRESKITIEGAGNSVSDTVGNSVDSILGAF